MGFKTVISVLLLGAAVLPEPSKADEECAISGSDRRECGWLGIDEETCEERNCCWDDSDPNAKFCFEKKGAQCAISGSDRWECGWLGIDEETCEERNCCWDDSDPNAKFCFVKRGTTLPEGLCPVAPSERQECGYYGITKEECLYNECCWDETVENTKWCFKQPEEPVTGCFIYHGVEGTCRYTCSPDDKKMYGMGVCKGKICCYQGYQQAN